MAGKPFDASLKDMIEEHARAWAELVMPGPILDAAVIDADASTVTAAADKVIRVRTMEGDCLLDLEAQSGHDAAKPGRMLLYSVVLEQRHHLPVRSVIVLLRREANSTSLTGVVELRHAPADPPYLTFHYTVVRLWQQPLAPLLAGPVGLLPLAPLTDEAAADLPGVVDQIIRRFRAETTRAEAAKMETATLILMGMRYEKTVVEQLFQGVTDMEESSGYQLIEERGMAKGEQRALIRTLLDLGRRKFGEPDANQLSAIQGIEDLARLDELIRRRDAVATWEELLA